MNTQKLREVDVRLAIMKLKLTPVTKLVFLAILQKIDWSNFAGVVSSKDCADLLNHNVRSVTRAIVELKELGYIIRSSYKLESERNSKGHTRINIDLLFGSDTMSDSDTMSQGAMTPCHTYSDTMSHNTIIQLNKNLSLKSDTLSLPKAKVEKRLVLNEIKSIEAEIKRRGLDDTFDNRKLVARMLFKIELRKGGYYETI